MLISAQCKTLFLVCIRFAFSNSQDIEVDFVNLMW